MKLDKLHLYARTQVGSWGMVLYDTVLESDVLIQPMSLVMKGAKVPRATTWQGIPISRSYSNRQGDSDSTAIEIAASVAKSAYAE